MLKFKADNMEKMLAARQIKCFAVTQKWLQGRLTR